MTLNHELVRIDVPTLSRSQHDLLWMRLRADDVPFSFDGQDVAVSLLRADDAHAAVEWVTHELAVAEKHYETPRPFQWTLEDGFLGSVPLFAIAAASAWIGIYLPILWDPAGQGLHDRAAQTYVLRTARSLASSK